MTIYLQLFFVACVVVFVVDLSGWSGTVTAVVSRMAGRRVREVRPLTCSLCMTWWTCLGYAVGAGSLSLPVLAWIALLSFVSGTIAQAVIFIREAASALLRLLADKLRL